MRRFVIAAFILAVFSCSAPSNKLTNAELIDKLESSINAIDSSNYGYEKSKSLMIPLLDSLLALDSSNYLALKLKGITAFNDRRPQEAVPYLTKALRQDTSECITHLILGWCLEEIGEHDEAIRYYESSLKFDPDEWIAPWMISQVVTILNGKEAGLANLEQSKGNYPEQFYYQTRNSINLYSGEGLSSLSFPPFFNLEDTNYFYINIPEQLYNSGQINSRGKVETLFAKLGVNISVKSSHSSDRGYKIFTTKKYLNKLMSIDTLGIKKL